MESLKLTFWNTGSNLYCLVYCVVCTVIRVIFHAEFYLHVNLQFFTAHFGPNLTRLQAKNGVRIVSTDMNQTILHITKREVVWAVPAKVHDLDTTHVVSHRVRFVKIQYNIHKNLQWLIHVCRLK